MNMVIDLIILIIIGMGVWHYLKKKKKNIKKPSNDNNKAQRKTKATFCSECGTRLEEDAVFCAECGVKIETK